MQKLFFLLLFTQFTFSQSTSTLEEKIYVATETFQANQNQESLQKLIAQEKTFYPKTKPELLALVFLNCNKAYYQKQIGATQNAIKSYEKAWQVYQKNKLSGYDIIEYCLKPLGNLYTIIGDYDNAENTIKQYFYLANIQKSSSQKYAAILNLSNVYQTTGKIDEAIDLLEKTIKTEKISTTQKGILYTNLGNNYLIKQQNLITEKNDFTTAEKAFLTSINLLKSDKSQTESLSKAYRNLSKLHLDSNLNLANSYFEKAKIEFNTLQNIEPRKKAQFFLEEAILLFKKEKLVEATHKIREVFATLIPSYTNSKTILPNTNSLYAETTLLDVLDLQAAVFLKQNQPKKALESYQLCFYIESLFQQLLVYENSKIITQIRNRNRTEKCIEVYNSLYQKEKNTTYLESAFLLQEKTKSAVLQSYIQNKKTFSNEEKRIHQQLQNWNTIIIKEQQKLDYADISKINEAIKKQNELMLLLKSETSKNTINSESELKIDDLYSKLENDNAIMVEYFFGYEKIYVFTIENKKIKLESISNKDTATPKIVQFLDYFSDAQKITNDVRKFNYYAFSLYEMLKLPKKSNVKNLIIIPDGVLSFLPFETLITKETKTTNFSKMHYLLKIFKIGYNNSATFYVNSIPFAKTKEMVLGVFPVFENSSLELTFSKKELVSIQKNFNGKYLDKQNATFANFTANASSYSILHLSTHASSGDIMEPASIMFFDKKIMYSELYNLNIKPNLVVLSACETGLGKLYKAEGAMSIARGFQFAGAQNLLFSLWKVNDYTTSVFMNNFYKNIKNGKSYFDANHQAKLDFLNNLTISNAKKSPYYWSAFVYYGTMESNNYVSQNYLLWLGVFVAIIILFLVFRKIILTKFSPNMSKKNTKFT